MVTQRIQAAALGEIAEASLRRAGLWAEVAHRLKASPLTLSEGQQQRLCIARAVVNRPNILIADEPTANLDAEYADSIMEVFRSFNQVGVTVLIATHDERALHKLQPRVLALQHGSLA